MGHTPHTWTNGDTISAAILNTLEQDLAAAATAAGQAAAIASAVAPLAPLASPAFTGTPTIAGAPVAKTSDVTAAIASLVNGAATALDTLAEIDAQIAADEGSAAALAALVASKQTAAQVASTVAAQATSDAATYAPKPATYLDPRTLPNGTLTGGFGNSPFTINAGALEHTPVPTSNGAAYYQRTLPAPVARIGCVADWDSNATGSVALVLPGTAWSDSSLGSAGIHATVDATGHVGIGRFEAGTGVVAIHTGEAGTLTGGRHLIEVALDSRRSAVTVLIDGTVILTYADATAFTMIGTRAVWELYEVNGSSDVPARLLALWADVESRVPPAAPLTAPAPGGSASTATTKVVNPDSLSTTIVTGYPGVQIGAGALAMSVKFPPSGKLLVTLGINFTITGGPDNILVNATTDGNPGYAVNVAQTDSAAYRTITTLIVGTPGATSVIDWNAFKTGSAFAAFYIGSSYGVAIVAAVPTA
jgi:hypothetical protein